ALAKQCQVDFNGVALGSYARKMIKQYIVSDNFYTDKKNIFSALREADYLLNSNIGML
ncbi:MAG: hypothetical protein HQK51_20705, partial [Oligoflexia bacterium]|nr:hypothetical protein [Oligoflexia bacterium]